MPRWLAAAVLLLLGGCVAPQQAAGPAHTGAPQRWTAVLVAGDGSLPVFDNATGAMAALLERSGVAAGDIHRFSATPAVLAKPHVQIASRARVLDAVSELRPGPGQACLVFITSHGAHDEGVYLAPRTEFLAPADLETALQAGCGTAPAVAIVSACYTGGFAGPPLTQPNHVLLTAAASDRPSFGCGAGREYTYFDGCLLDSFKTQPGDWPDLIDDTKRCVAALESKQHEQASDPQSFVGRDVAALPVLGG